MKSIVRHLFSIALGILMSSSALAATIYSTDFVETPTGATSTMSKAEWKTPAVSWAGTYANYFQTTGSAGTVTYTFSPALDLSGYTNVKLVVYWGATSNRPLKVGINGAAETQIDAVSTSGERSQVRTISTDITGNSLTSLKFISSGGGNVFLFHFDVTGDPKGGGDPTPGPGPTPTTYTITYDMNGHGTAISPVTGVTALPNPLPTPTETGYTFGGWYTDSNLSTAAVAGATISANTTLYAKWTQDTPGPGPTPTTYTITYNMNGHGTAISPVTGATALPNPLPTPTETGYTFGGWYTDSSLSTAAVEGATISANTTLYAKWTQNVTPPTTTLALHVPEVYESSLGYNTPLTVFGGREYEVYYAGRDGSSNITITTTPAIKTNGITGQRSNTACTAQDGWFEISAPSQSSSYTPAAKDEFATGSSAIHKIQNNGYYKLHIQGYDQFSFYGMDNNTDKAKGKYLEVRIDGQLQDMTLSTTASIRRFNLTTGEHVIEIKGLGASNDQIIGFSLRIAEEPRVKWVKGNDSTQVIFQTQTPKPVFYFTKYSNKGRTELVWDGPQATGISLLPYASSSLGDTMLLGGTALCPVGVYHYHVVAYNAQNQETSRVNGKFSVACKITETTDTSITVWEKSSMTPIVFKYYAANDADVTYSWVGTAPVGLTFTQDTAANKLSIGGIPTSVGTYKYQVSVADGNTITGTIVVESSSPTVVPGASKTMLYLYKVHKEEGLFSYLKTRYNYFARPAGETLLAASEYNDYDFIVISEDVDATNNEVLSIIRNLNKPVLNMKIFTYSNGRLDWGDPDNGSITNTHIQVVQGRHPIFSGFTQSDIEVISEVQNNRGLMSADIREQGGYCLALAPKRAEDYVSDGDAQTFIHEVPETVRGAKYLTFPIGNASAGTLTADGKRLVDNMISYLCGTTSFSTTIDLRITSFLIDGIAAQIDEQKQEITIEMPYGTDLTALTPVVTLADASAHVTPGSGETVDLSDMHYGLKYTVTDYINKRTYVVRARVAAGLDDATDDGLIMEGTVLRNTRSQWVNIYNVSGRMLTTTNSDFDFTSMPNGMYLVVSENGTIKVIR